MCFNVSVACSHEKGTSMEIRSRERGEELWSGDGGEEGKKTPHSRFIVSPLTVFL